jgi:hypothetical protein
MTEAKGGVLITGVQILRSAQNDKKTTKKDDKTVKAGGVNGKPLPPPASKSV